MGVYRLKSFDTCALASQYLADGLLWVSTLMPAGIHDRVMAETDHDRSAGNTKVYVLNANGGRQYEPNYGEFAKQ